MKKDAPILDRNLLGGWTPWIVALVLAAVLGGIVILARESGRDRRPADLDAAFLYDVERYKFIPPEKIGYREVARIETGLREATALAVGPDDRIAVGGDRTIRVYRPEGALEGTISTGGAPLALTASPDGSLFAATRNAVGRCEFRAPLRPLFTIPGEKARITSIAAAGDYLFVADAGSRGVWRYTRDGEPRGRIGDRDEDRGIPGFAVPSPYFDVLIAPDGLLRIVDPGRHLIRAFTVDGDLELSWGRPTFALEGFCGCCNPSHLAMLADGSFVTSEKGMPRVKIHDADGNFVTAVVASDGLDTEYDPCDVAADSRGRVLVLDPGRKAVRIFMAVGRADHED